MVELVLGGEGLIGSELVRVLSHSKKTVRSIDLKSKQDLRKPDEKWFDNVTRVWFLAWDTGGAKYIENEKLQHQMFMNNCGIMLQVFDILERRKLPFLFVSSQLAGQRNAYGMMKLAAQTWAEQLGGKIARLWNVYGWEQPGIRSHVITDLVLSGLKENVVRIRTNGDERRRFLYKGDSVNALMTLFDSSQQYAEIAGPEWVKIKKVAEIIAEKLKVDYRVGEGKGEEVMIDPQKQLEGWHSQVPLEEGISKVIDDAQAYLSQNKT